MKIGRVYPNSGTMFINVFFPKSCRKEIVLKMEFLIGHPLRVEFGNAIMSDNLELAGEMLNRDPDLGNYNYSEVMKDALSKGNVRIAEFMRNNNLDITGARYESYLKQALERGDFQTADFMLRKNLSLRNCSWSHIGYTFERKGNKRVANWIETHSTGKLCPDPSTMRPIFKSRNLNLLYDIEEAVNKKKRDPYLIRYIIRAFPPDLFDTYTAKRLEDDNTEILDIILKERPISESVLERGLEEAKERNDDVRIKWIKRQQTPTPENIAELKRLLNNFRFSEADTLLENEPSLLKADLSDIFKRNLMPRVLFPILDYIEEKKFPVSLDLINTYGGHKLYNLLNNLMNPLTSD